MPPTLFEHGYNYRKRVFMMKEKRVLEKVFGMSNEANAWKVPTRSLLDRGHEINAAREKETIFTKHMQCSEKEKPVGGHHHA